MSKKITILGSTGSIGKNAIEVVRRNSNEFRIAALAAGSNVDELAQQIQEFQPEVVSVKDEISRTKLLERIDIKTDVLIGEDGACDLIKQSDPDIVLSAMVGFVGLIPTLYAIREGKTIALANKETLVAAGSIMMDEAKRSGANILPVDSEHSAIFQSMQGFSRDDVKKIILTASGGPLFKYSGDLSEVTKEEALNHPNWSMGAKITIDSATMMNKGLEIIEAYWIFGIDVDKIEVVIHPQSIIHSMVEYIDGSIMAQMGEPDMRVPISYAFSYPKRRACGVTPLDWKKMNKLTFYEPNDNRFPLLNLCKEAIREGGSIPASVNAANEVAVDAFLKNEITFDSIYKIILSVMEKIEKKSILTLDDVKEADRTGRELAVSEIGRHA